jgi:hypothetical protein
MKDRKDPAWQELYAGVMQERNEDRLLVRMGEAEHAIFQRLQVLAVSPDGDAEKRDLQAACDDLLRIKTERLGWPSLPGKRPEGQAEDQSEGRTSAAPA